MNRKEQYKQKPMFKWELRSRTQVLRNRKERLKLLREGQPFLGMDTENLKRRKSRINQDQKRFRITEKVKKLEIQKFIQWVNRARQQINK